MLVPGVDRRQPEKFIKVKTRPVGKIPFAQESAPVVLEVRGRLIPEWSLVDHSAGETPVTPVHSDQPDTTLELIPYGSTRLRMTEFPAIKTGRSR
jgi:hypothetical protein